MKSLAGLLGFAGVLAVVLGTWGPTLWPTLIDARSPLVVGGAGTVVAAILTFRRAQRDSWRKMGARGYSYCGDCNYPFDDGLTDDAVVTCSECGKRFRAGASREWFRDLAQ